VAHTSSTPSFPAGRRHRFLWLVAFLGAAVLCVFSLTLATIVRFGGAVKDLGWVPQEHLGVAVVGSVDPAGPAASSLVPGDRLMAVDDHPVVPGALWWQLWGLRPGRSYSLRVEHGGNERELQLVVSLKHDSTWLWRTLSLAPVCLAFAISGLLVGLARPRDPAPRAYALASLMLSAGYLTYSLPYDLLTLPERLTALLARGAIQPAAALSYHFYRVFPTKVPQGRVWDLLGVILTATGVILGLAWVSVALVLSLGPAFAVSWLIQAVRLPLQITDTTFSALVTVSALAIVVQKYRILTGRDARRRVEWVLMGSIVAIAPIAVVAAFALLALIGGRVAWLSSRTYMTLLNACRVLQVVLPITIFHAILKRRLFDITLVLRLGLQYLLAKNLLRCALLLPIALVIGGILAHPQWTVGEVLFAHPAYPLLMAASGVCLRSRGRLTVWVDRRFFRDAYAKEQLLLALVEDVGRHDSISGLSDVVGRRLEEALHPDGLRLLFRANEGRDFKSVNPSGEGPEGFRIVEGSSLVQRAESAVGAVELTSTSEAGEPETLGARMLVPIRTNDGSLIGMFLLGGKRSEEPYSQKDRKLLEALATQIAIVHENETLKKRVAEGERVQREVLARLDQEGVNLLKECPRCGLCYDQSTATCERDHESLTFTLPIQRTIGGRYRLEKLLGKGGMGAVYEASDVRLDRRVAVKVLSAASFGNLKALRRFEFEGRALARLRHPNIVAVHDLGEIDPQGAYIVMELLDGMSLRSEIAASGGLPPVLVADWFYQIFEGVKAAHRSGVVHRDLKPGNVIVSRDVNGRPLLKILDFGLAKLRRPEGSDSESLTTIGVVMGTRAYMSPEQLAGREVDQRTDIFALGVMILECLTGENPLRDRDAVDTAAAGGGYATRIEGESPEIHALNSALAKCLSLDPEARFPTAAAMQEALVPLIRDCPRCRLAGGRHSDTDTSVV